MNQLTLYSGNVTSVPHGHDLASMYSPTDYIRLWTTIGTGIISRYNIYHHISF